MQYINNSTNFIGAASLYSLEVYLGSLMTLLGNPVYHYKWERANQGQCIYTLCKNTKAGSQVCPLFRGSNVSHAVVHRIGPISHLQ